MGERRQKPLRTPGIAALTALFMAAIPLMPKVAFADTNSDFGKPPEVTGSDGKVTVEVSTPLELQYIDLNQGQYVNSNIELMNSLDMTGDVFWSPIVDFRGTFNGNNHSISHLSFSSTATVPSTLISWVGPATLPVADSGIFADTLPGANIENLILNDINIENTSENPSDNVGSLVGVNGGIIQNVAVLSGTIQDGKDTSTGITINGDPVTAIGGLVGWNNNTGKIINCYVSNAEVNAADTADVTYLYLGTLLGYNAGDVSNSIATGNDVWNGGDVGPFGADILGSSADQHNQIVWENNETQNPGPDSGYHTPTLEQTSTYTTNLTQETWTPFDMTNTWSIIDGVTFPFLRGTLPITSNSTTPTQGQVFTAQMSTEVTPPNGQSLTWHPISLPQGFSLSSSGTLTGTPTTAGPLTVTAVAYLSPTEPVVYGYGTVNLDVQPGQITVISLNPTLPKGTVGTPYHATLNASGGTSPYTYTITAGDLPSGLSLASDGTLSGTPTSDGSFSFTAQATDATGTTGSQSYTMVIIPPTLSNDANLSNLGFSQGTLSPAFGSGTSTYTATVSHAVSNVQITPVVEDGNAKVTVNGEAVMSRTAATVALNVGSNTVTVLVTAQDGTTKTYTITITRQAAYIPAPVPQPTPLQSTTPILLSPGTPGTAFSTRLTATGGVGSYTWSIVSGALPHGLQLNPQTGLISGYASSGQPVILTVQAVDAMGAITQQQIVIDAITQNQREIVWQANGLRAANVPAITANDSGVETTYMPIWYVMQMLKSFGVQSTWDGRNWNLNTFMDVPPNPVHGKRQMRIYVNGHLLEVTNGIYALDPNSHKVTTYMPIWYVQQVLNALDVSNTWNGATWSVDVTNPH